MKKRIISMILAVALMFSLAAVTSITASAETYGDFEYELLDDGTVVITGYNGSSETFDIPSTIDGKTVSRIQMGAFDDTAYYNNKSNWENGVLYIGNCLISGKLTAYDEELHEYYVITEAKDDYKVKDGTKIIADDAFAGCLFLTSVTIPDSVTSVGISPFEYCESLADINVSADNKNYSSENGVLFNKDKTELIKYPIGKTDETYTIPNSVTHIYDYAFMLCRALTSVTIADNVTTIGYSAFGHCSQLSSVTIGNSVTYIDSNAFIGCESLANITIPDSVTNIGAHVFHSTAICDNEANWKDGVLYIGNCLISGKLKTYNQDTYEYDVITEVNGDYTIEDGTRIIADFAFSDCDSLTSVIIPDSVTNIGDYAFESCDSLTSVTIPNSITNIGISALEDCTSLKSVTIPSSVINIGYYAFGYCYNRDEFVTQTIPDFHIYCYPDTAGEQYAIDNEFDYIVLKTPSVTVTQPTAGTVKKTENGDGTITLTATANKLAAFTNWVIDGDYEIVEGSLTSETITIRPKADGIKISADFNLPTTGTYGDVNYDGKVNMLDVLLIRKYIAKQPIDLDDNLADVTCDDKVNMLDVLLIRKYIAKQPVILGPKG